MSSSKSVKRGQINLTLSSLIKSESSKIHNEYRELNEKRAILTNDHRCERLPMHIEYNRLTITKYTLYTQHTLLNINKYI